MKTLKALQAQYQSALLRDQPPAPRLIKTDGAASFDVYRNAYRARLRAALRDNFETLPLVMGDDAFDELANAYIAATPSAHYSLRWFGHRLAEFMATHDELVAHPAMLDLARLEWALRGAFDADSSAVLTGAELAVLPAEAWPEMHLALQPSVQVLSLQWAVGPVWHALKAGQSDVPAPEAMVHDLLIWRQGLQPQWKSLSDIETIFVRDLQAGRSFGELCENLGQIIGENDAAPTAVAVLRELLGGGVIASVQSAEATSC